MKRQNSPVQSGHLCTWFVLVLDLHPLLNGPELSLLGRSGGADLRGQLLVHQPLSSQPLLKLNNPVIDVGHLILSHGELGPLFSSNRSGD